MADAPVLEEAPSTRGVYRRFAAVARPYRREALLALAVSVLSAGALVSMAPIIGRAIDELVQRSRSGLFAAVATLAVVVVARIFLLRTSEVLLTRTGERVVRDLRDTAVARIATAPLRFIESHRVGDLLQRTTGEVATVTDFVRQQLPDVVNLSLSLLLTLAVLVSYSPLLTLITLAVTLPTTWLAIRWFRRDATTAYGRVAAGRAGIAATFTETLAGRETLHLTGGMPERRRRFAAQNAELRAAEDHTVDVELRLRLIGFLEGLSVAVLLVAGAWLAGQDRVTIGTVAVFVLATANLFEGVLRLSQVFGELQATAVSLARLLDLLDRTADRSPSEGAALPKSGDLTVRGVHYAYRAGTDVLAGVDVTFPHGAHVVVAGPTGSGKSTLVKLASGLYRPDAGTVTFGGVDLATATEAEVRRRVVLVPQQVHLVSGTLADNLALVPHEPTRDELLDAVDRLGLTAWLAGLPAGLDTVVGPYGSALSAGEQQLVGIVRAALVDPAVLILDEATADLDPAVAAGIETAVDRVRAGRTLILVAHRPETIARHADVVRVDDGVVSVS